MSGSVSDKDENAPLARAVLALCGLVFLAACLFSLAGLNGLIGLFVVPAVIAFPLFAFLAVAKRSKAALVIYCAISALWLSAGARLFLMPLDDYEGLWAVIVWPSQQFTIVAAGIGWIAGRWWLGRAG